MRKLNFLALLGVFMLLNVANVSAAIIVLKEGGDLNDASTTASTGDDGELNAVFAGATSANVVQVEVEDTRIIENAAAGDLNFGQETTIPNLTDYSLFKFDLSSVPGLNALAVINTAEFRVRGTNGNTQLTFASVITRDWTEELATRNSPIGDPNSPNQWGALGDSSFSSADVTVPVNFNHGNVGNAFNFHDVTAQVQAALTSPSTYFGWAVQNGNHTMVTSENAANGDRPALYIDYIPGVPEPASLLLAGLCLGWVAASRTRRC